MLKWSLFKRRCPSCEHVNRLVERDLEELGKQHHQMHCSKCNAAYPVGPADAARTVEAWVLGQAKHELRTLRILEGGTL